MKLTNKDAEVEKLKNQKKPFLIPKILKINVNETKGKDFMETEIGEGLGPS